MSEKSSSIFYGAPRQALVFGSAGCGLTAVLTALMGGFLSSLVITAFWTLPFLAVIVGVGSVIAKPLSRLPLFGRYLMAFPLGFLMAYLWAWCPIAMLGPWSMNLGPVMPIWIVGSVSGLVAASSSVNAKPVKLSIQWALILVLAAVAAFGTQPIYELITGYRDVGVSLVRWEPNATPAIETSTWSAADRARLEALNLGGRLHSNGWRGTQSGSNIIVIIQHPVTQSEELYYPGIGNIIYVQEKDGWHTIPPNAWTTSKGIELSQDEKGNTTCWQEELGGGKSLCGGITWP